MSIASHDRSSAAVMVPMRALAIVSLLGDEAGGHAATRRIGDGREISVLDATLARIKAAGVAVRVVAWDDQLPALADVLPLVRSQGVRRAMIGIDETAAALRWSDGWRGALLGKTTFDRGFGAEAIVSVLDEEKADAAILIDPAAAFIEPATIIALIDHLAALPEQTYSFAPGAVGSGAMILRRDAVAELARLKRGPGFYTMYHPDRPAHDPIAKSFAIPVSSAVARSAARITVDSDRQAKRLSLVQAGGVEAIVDALAKQDTLDPMPREVTLELTTRRSTRPAWSMLAAHEIDRPDLTLDAAKQILTQLAGVDDVRLTLAGVGDPLLHPRAIAIIHLARAAGIRAIHLETDLLPDDAATLDALAGGELDIISVHLPAAYAGTYTRLMGVDRMREVLENIKRLLLSRARRGSGVPILTPTFVKCEANLGEMETWYDQWIRAVGTAVITGPSDFGGRIAYAGVADMTAGRRRPCRRLQSRLTILCDGSVASCEEDVLGERPCGSSGSLAAAWTQGLAMLRSLHAEHRWDESELCNACRMWDRP